MEGGETVKDNIEIFSERLRVVMAKKRITIRNLARTSGVSSATISSYRMASRMPGLDQVILLAKALGVSLDWLCGLEGEYDQLR